MKKQLILFSNLLFCLSLPLLSQVTVLKPDQVFDGEQLHKGWIVLVEGERIKAAGNANELTIPSDATRVDLSGTTLMPGMIEGHSHILLHPYDETGWNDQVLVESITERVVRATVHAKNTLMAGFTTIRDLGSEGAEYADVGVKKSIDKGIIPGPRMIVAGKAIVATGSYGPKGFAPHVKVPLGAEVADGHDNLIKVVRDQIGKGADVIKVYADYRWGPYGQAMATFTQEELELMVKIANSSSKRGGIMPNYSRRRCYFSISRLEKRDGARTSTNSKQKKKYGNGLGSRRANRSRRRCRRIYTWGELY